MSFTQQIRTARDRVETLTNIIDDLLEIDQADDQARTSAKILPVMYKYLGRLFNKNDTIFDEAYVHIGAILRRRYPACVQHYFMNNKALEQRDQALHCIEEHIDPIPKTEEYHDTRSEH